MRIIVNVGVFRAILAMGFIVLNLNHVSFEFTQWRCTSKILILRSISFWFIVSVSWTKTRTILLNLINDSLSFSHFSHLSIIDTQAISYDQFYIVISSTLKDIWLFHALIWFFLWIPHQFKIHNFWTELAWDCSYMWNRLLMFLLNWLIIFLIIFLQIVLYVLKLSYFLLNRRPLSFAFSHLFFLFKSWILLL